ncbi:hypothetical protein H9X54_001930 [Flavobacterium macrobrachii]|uniref:Uncharacterized protein n=1 Tax=Flavobacterium macrobrachii TaxID=591204 RepID=A0ABS2CT00_9FLAO|nr:hypothetical protein [Flavobacterium macrobrachii]MBM6498060.1 hypothetical protein [Flavobacterium macrobrachii]
MNLVKRNTVHLPSIIDEFLKPDWFGGMQNYAPNIPAVNIKETDTAFGLELNVIKLRKNHKLFF